MGDCFTVPIKPKYDGVDVTCIDKQDTVDKQTGNTEHILTLPHHQQIPSNSTHLEIQNIGELATIQEDESITPLYGRDIKTDEDEFSMKEISRHNKVDDLWIVLNNKVYDVTAFWQQHPVNPQYVFRFGGKDATDAFNAAGHSEYADKLAVGMKIGVLAEHYCQNQGGNRKRSVSTSIVQWDSLEQTKLERDITIKYIYVYPVKGCGGVELQSTWIDQSGVYNDRMYCFVDADTHQPINQLKYPKLSLIQPVLKHIDRTEDIHRIELYYVDKNGEKNSITVKSKYDKNHMIEIDFVNSDTKIRSYDQGNEVSDWITDYLHTTMDIDIVDKNKLNKRFRFCKIMRSNIRLHEDYFSLPFVAKQDQPIKGVLNYSAIHLASQESLNELNRRWHEKNAQNEPFGWDTWRANIVVEGLPKAHFEDFAKFITINDDVELLWNRRRHLCTVPTVTQSTGIQTTEPSNILTRYRNAVTLNDATAKPGRNAVFFGSFFLVKQGGEIRVGDSVNIKQTQFNITRTNRARSFYGNNNLTAGNKNFQLKTLTQYQSYKLSKKEILTHDVYHLRFELAGNTSNLLQHESLRLNIGGHYLLKIPDKSNKISVIRAYTPIVLDANDENESYFDLVIKIYKKGKMSHFFKHMQIGDFIDGKQYYGGIRYVEIGKFRFGDPSHFQVKHWSFNVNYINMICGGTGICPMMQIIQCIHNNQIKGIDNTKINVFVSNRTINDVLLVDQLNEIEKNNENIKIYYVITSKKGKSKNKRKKLKITQFGKRINANVISKYGFKPTDDCIVLLCGPPKMDIAMNECCKQVGFDEKRIHTF